MHRSQQSVSDSNFELSPVADLDVVAEDASLTRYNQTHLTPRDHSSGKRRSTCSRQYGSVKRACSARSTAIVPPSQQAIIPSNALDENVHIVCDWPPTFPYHGSALAARLAPELLSDIFERLVLQLNTHNSLPQLCLVSKRWRQAAARILYRNPCLDGRWFLPEGEHPAAPRSNVTKLLDTLAASNQSYLSATLSLELPLGHFVRKLDLADGLFDHANINLLHDLLKLCPKLKTLKICANIGVQTISCITSFCTVLESLSVTIFASESELTVESAISPSSSALGYSTPSRLRNLLVEVRSRHDTSPSTVNTVAHSSHSMDFLPYVLSPSLRELHLSGIASNDVLHSVSSRLMPELEILRLTECSGLTDETMISIAGRCQGLRVLDVWGSVHVTDAGISAFATPDHVINDDLQNSIPPSRGASLEAVDITYTAVTDRGISVLSACPRLHTVFMEGISCSVDSIIELIKKCGPRLRELILCGCLERQNGTAEFELLVAGEPEAEERRAPAGWPFGRDGGIDTGASHSAPGPPAESMDTRMDQEQSSTSSSMSDVERTLFSLAEHCPNLVQLDVVACGDRICGSAVLAVLRSCSSLRTFAVEESAVGSTMWRWMKEKSGYEVEGVFVSPFWGVNF